MRVIKKEVDTLRRKIYTELLKWKEEKAGRTALLIDGARRVSPIEVKSGGKYTLTSLKKCREKYTEQLDTLYVLHKNDLKVEEGIVYLPLYMTPLL